MTRIVCHRGARLNAPENTFSSARTALALGGSIIELDIRQSADGVLYVMHDETVDRTTDGTGRILELTSSQIDRLDAGSWFDERFANERVPRLDEYLSAFMDEAGFYLEIKWADCAAVGQLVRGLGIEDRCFTFSFDPAMREQMFLHAPGIRRMILWIVAGSVQSAIDQHRASIVEFHDFDFDTRKIVACQEAGLEVMYYTDRQDLPRFQEALDLEMDFVNIDEIEAFDRLRHRQKAGP